MSTNVFTELLYQKPIETSMREVTEAYQAVFDGNDENVRIVVEDLIRLTSFGSTGINPDQNIQYFTSGLETVVKHIINTISRKYFIDESDIDDATGEV